MWDRYSCIIHLIPNKFTLKTLLRHLYSIPFVRKRFPETKWRKFSIDAKTSLQRHSCIQRFREQNHRRNNQSCRNAFRILRHANNSAIMLSIFQFQTHLQTARESPDLKTDCLTLRNGLKQLYEQVFMRKYKCSDNKA